jgi:hypothetical protein
MIEGIAVAFFARNKSLGRLRRSYGAGLSHGFSAWLAAPFVSALAGQ